MSLLDVGGSLIARAGITFLPRRKPVLKTTQFCGDDNIVLAAQQAI